MLWLLKRVRCSPNVEIRSFVISATTEDEARSVAANAVEQADFDAWFDSAQTTCRSLNDAEPPGVVLFAPGRLYY